MNTPYLRPRLCRHWSLCCRGELDGYAAGIRYELTIGEGEIACESVDLITYDLQSDRVVRKKVIMNNNSGEPNLSGVPNFEPNWPVPNHNVRHLRHTLAVD